MTEQEAGRVLAVVLAGTVQRERSAEDLAFLRRYLIPLPYGPVLRRVEEYVAQLGRGKDGKATHSWISTPGELLEACGVPERAALSVVRAMRDGGQVLPDLRSMDGWSYVAPRAELPQGVAEAAAVAREPQSDGEILSLNAGKPALVADVAERVKALARAKRMEPVPGRIKEKRVDLSAAQAIVNSMPSQEEFERQVRESALEEREEEEAIPW